MRACDLTELQNAQNQLIDAFKDFQGRRAGIALTFGKVTDSRRLNQGTQLASVVNTLLKSPTLVLNDSRFKLVNPVPPDGKQTCEYRCVGNCSDIPPSPLYDMFGLSTAAENFVEALPPEGQVKIWVYFVLVP